MASSISVLLTTPGRERSTLRRALESTLKHSGVRAGDEVLVGNPGANPAVAAAASWAANSGFSPATVREVLLPAGIPEGAARNALGGAALCDLVVYLDDADMFYGNGVEVLRRASDEQPGHAVLALTEERGGVSGRLACARRERRGNWLAPSGYLQDTVARHGGQSRSIQAVVYLIRPFPEKW